jgi:hypothetical protein
VLVSNADTIAQLESLQSGGRSGHPNGRLERGPGDNAHNDPWHWHLDPMDISLGEATTEGCDATPSYVESHLEEFLSQSGRFCPWRARLVSLTVTRS